MLRTVWPLCAILVILYAATVHQAKSQNRVKNFLQGAKYLAEKIGHAKKIDQTESKA
jgi:hypothetical protein